MHFPSLLFLTLLSTLSTAAVVKRQSDTDFLGTGNIFVVPVSSGGIQNANASNIVGCITATGRFVTDTTRCGVFTRRENQAFRSTAGVCSFMDPTAEVGRPQAPQGYAFKCSPTTEPLSAFYSFGTPDAGPGQAWIWQGNLNPTYESKVIPPANGDTSIWYYTFGQDRIFFHWLWKKLGD